jgi:hypothetical protein
LQVGGKGRRAHQRRLRRAQRHRRRLDADRVHHRLPPPAGQSPPHRASTSPPGQVIANLTIVGLSSAGKISCQQPRREYRRRRRCRLHRNRRLLFVAASPAIRVADSQAPTGTCTPGPCAQLPAGGRRLRPPASKPSRVSARFATHSGRRTVVTSMFVEGDEALEDIARFVGYSRPATTAGYVKRLGRRPQAVAERAALLDPFNRTGQAAEVRNQPADSASTPVSNAPELSAEHTYGDGQ